MAAFDWITAGARLAGGASDATGSPACDVISPFEHAIRRLAALLPQSAAVGLIADNAPQWIGVELALQRAGLGVVPLPQFFSREQSLHAVCAAQMQALVCADRALAAELGFGDECDALDGTAIFRRTCGARGDGPGMLRGGFKITFTSGTTGAPKGVLLSLEQQLQSARALARLLAPIGIRRHMSVLPLPVLLENVAGAYTAMMLGATCICPPLSEVGVRGASAFDPQRCLEAIAQHQPESMILLPQMLQALVARLARCERPREFIGSLKLVAVGGGSTPVRLIASARALGLAVYEGYGLTECGSVVCLNVPWADRLGSVGRPLPGVGVRLAADGEIEISGRSFAGYLGAESTASQRWLESGDLGAMDAYGFVTVTGRKKHVLVTSFGRNVAPEWPESLLLESPLIAQAAVFGDARPYLAAVVVAASQALDAAAIEAHVARVNARLPDYARIGGWLRADEPFSADNGLATQNGRIRRDRVGLRYAKGLAAIYRDEDRLFAPRPIARERRRSQESCMTFYEQLQLQTTAERQSLLQIPIIEDALEGRISRTQYIAFLTQAYHHVRHTVPLLMACGSRLPHRLGWLVSAIARYIEEEVGHDEWILADLAVCGADSDAICRGRPGFETELMIAYAYHQIDRGNPVGFFGMVQVLEGTSVAIATAAADAIARSLELPRQAFTYLNTHGSLDMAHVKLFESLMNRIADPDDRGAVIDSARAFYRLYGDIFRALPREARQAACA